MKTDILGVAFDALTLDEAEERADALLRSGAGGYIVTANPEIVLHCREDAAYAAAVNGAALVLADGVGDLCAARILGTPLPERVTGADLVPRLLSRLAQRSGSVFLYGARPGVAQRAGEKLKNAYPGLRIAGAENGYISDETALFAALEQKDPDHFAVRQYKKFLLSAGKTRSSILISCGARLAPFDIREVRELMEDDEMELDTIGDEKTVLFLIMSDTDTTFNFILAMLQSQLINLLCDRADDKYGGRLPVHVRLILDEFANIGQIPNFDKLIATIRSREISASIILQSQSQLKAIYKDAAEIISDNCDSVLFLSGRGKNAKEISDALGKETIDSFNTSENRGSQTSHGLNYQKLGKALMSEDEIAIMDGGRCILQLRGVRPFFSEKFDITKHPHYKYLADADKKNTFDVDRFLSTLRRKRQQVVAQDESFDLYEIDLSDGNTAE